MRLALVMVASLLVGAACGEANRPLVTSPGAAASERDERSINMSGRLRMVPPGPLCTPSSSGAPCPSWAPPDGVSLTFVGGETQLVKIKEDGGFHLNAAPGHYTATVRFADGRRSEAGVTISADTAAVWLFAGDSLIVQTRP